MRRWRRRGCRLILGRRVFIPEQWAGFEGKQYSKNFYGNRIWRNDFGEALGRDMDGIVGHFTAGWI
jgi:hypothetical protein